MTVEKLFEILLWGKPSNYLRAESIKADLFKLIPDLKRCDGFSQNSVWHPHDVYEHIIRVVDGVPSDINLRLAALFHDIEKPRTYEEEIKEVDINEEEKGVTYKVVDGKKYKVIGHFPNHWTLSSYTFIGFATENHLEDIEGVDVALIEKLIKYHDIRGEKLTQSEKNEIADVFTLDELDKLYQLRDADLRAQNPSFYNRVHLQHKIEKATFKEMIVRKRGVRR